MSFTVLVRTLVEWTAISTKPAPAGYTREQWAEFVLQHWEEVLERFLSIAVFSAKEVITPEMVADAILRNLSRISSQC